MFIGLLALAGCGTPEAAPTATAVPLPTPTTLATEMATFAPIVLQTAVPTPGTAVRIVNVYPHDPGAFTQGLVWDDGTVYEGTGLEGASSLRRVDLETGEVQQIHALDAPYFGEGIAVFGDRIIQLTYRNGTGFVYDKESFALLDTFSYLHEGWGITHDGTRLIVSDGSNRLRFWDPETLTEIGHVDVFDGGMPVTALNELEYVNGEVFANVWRTDQIVRIDPANGRVTGWIELDGLLTLAERTGTDVLNGIMYDPVENRLFVTGKWWPKLFEIELIDD
ncbi:MAG: glutaminyl-peptide cyclotransferase [Anaerolineales bacterium]|nr:glutaminyl-peptide cyclotransferase [Anaerolineales bacterium]